MATEVSNFTFQTVMLPLARVGFLVDLSLHMSNSKTQRLNYYPLPPSSKTQAEWNQLIRNKNKGKWFVDFISKTEKN